MMMEFIVLGQVPGTNFQITFNLIRNLLLLLLAVQLIKLDLRLYHSENGYKLTGPTGKSRILGYTLSELTLWLKGRFTRAYVLLGGLLHGASVKLVQGAKETWLVGVKFAVKASAVLLRIIRLTYVYVNRLVMNAAIEVKDNIMPEIMRLSAKNVKNLRLLIAQAAKRLRLWYLERRPT